MFLSGTLLNALLVLCGGLAGTFLGDRLPERLRDNAVRGVGLFTLVIGTKLAVDTGHLLYLLGSILIGGAIGSLASLDGRLNDAAAWAERRLVRRGPLVRRDASASSVAEAFVTSSIVFCVGPLTFLGAIQNGLTGDASLLTVKSVLDGISAVAFAASLGWGVLLSVAVILVYQGSLAAAATQLQGLLSEPQLREMSAVGGLLVLGVGLRLLRLRDVAVADFLPAIVVAPLLVAIAARVRDTIGP
ncbi:DUF554 domain-containing protein [soil metagenome]